MQTRAKHYTHAHTDTHTDTDVRTHTHAHTHTDTHTLIRFLCHAFMQPLAENGLKLGSVLLVDNEVRKINQDEHSSAVEMPTWEACPGANDTCSGLAGTMYMHRV